MELGAELYRYMLKDEGFTSTRQYGCSDIIIYLASHYDGENNIVEATDGEKNYGIARAGGSVWNLDHAMVFQEQAKGKGLDIYEIENFSPADWRDTLLDGPRKEEQTEYLKEIIRNAGKTGIRRFGYSFSFARVWGRQKIGRVRGGVVNTCSHAGQLNLDVRIPKDEIQNMTCIKNVREEYIGDIECEELWDRLKWSLERILPMVEEAGVMIALHPDDPSMPFLRGAPCLAYQPQLYQKVLDLAPSPCNGVGFCMGSIQEMTNRNIYDTLEQYSPQGKIGYAHVKNIQSKAPNYTGVFVDDGDINIERALEILKGNHFEGILIPDHTPQIQCQDIRRMGMAFVLGFIRAELIGLGRQEDERRSVYAAIRFDG